MNHGGQIVPKPSKRARNRTLRGAAPSVETGVAQALTHSSRHRGSRGLGDWDVASFGCLVVARSAETGEIRIGRL